MTSVHDRAKSFFSIVRSRVPIQRGTSSTLRSLNYRYVVEHDGPLRAKQSFYVIYSAYRSVVLNRIK